MVTKLAGRKYRTPRICEMRICDVLSGDDAIPEPGSASRPDKAGWQAVRPAALPGKFRP